MQRDHDVQYMDRLRAYTWISVEFWLDEIGLLVDVVRRQTSDQVAVLVDRSVAGSTHASVVVRTERVFGVTRRIARPRR